MHLTLGLEGLGSVHVPLMAKVTPSEAGATSSHCVSPRLNLTQARNCTMKLGG